MAKAETIEVPVKLLASPEMAKYAVGLAEAFSDAAEAWQRIAETFASLSDAAHKEADDAG